MNKIKMFYKGYVKDNVEERMNNWISENKPDIVDIRLGKTDSNSLAILIWYKTRM